MRTWAILPIKPFDLAKTRLAMALSPSERASLAERWYRHVLGAAQATREIDDVMVISRDARALAIAREMDAYTARERLPDDGAPSLNAALTQATERALHVVRSLDAVLLLPADLPLLQSADLAAMVALAGRGAAVVIAPDGKGDGTNAMLVRPPAMFPYMYGVGSFARHTAAAWAAGARVEVYRSERLMLDIDVPRDLALYYAHTQGETAWQTG